MSVPETNDVWTLIMPLIAGGAGQYGPDLALSPSMSASSPAASTRTAALARIQHISLRGSSPRIPARSAVSPEAAASSAATAVHLPKILESSTLLQQY
jgi:hypothetical protein